MPLRDQFPIFEDKIYFNSCSQGALSIDVRQAYGEYLDDWDQHGSPWELWMGKMESVRTALAGLVNADPNEIALATSVSAAVSALASGLDFSGERNKIVVSDFEFPTIAQIWHAQERRGAEIVHVPADGNVIPLEYFDAAIDERTLLVSITHVCYRNGSRLDVPAIVKLAHERGVLVLLDSYQALGTFPIDANDLKADFLVGGVLKYLLSSAGLAFMCVRDDLITTLQPTALGWFAQADPFAMDIYANSPAPTARRFESGTPPVPNIYAALAGVNLVRSVGLERIEAHLHEITGAIKAGARQRGFTITSPEDAARHGALITLRSHDVNALVSQLSDDGIITSSRDDNVRISAHFYNDMDDVAHLMDCLSRHDNLLT